MNGTTPRQTKAGDYLRKQDRAIRTATIKGGSGVSISTTSEGTTIRVKSKESQTGSGTGSNVPRWG